jgi:malonyl-ACP decarboxylase
MPEAFKPVAVTGMGIVCSIARDLPAFNEAIRAGRSGIVRANSSNGVRFGATLQDFEFNTWLEPLKLVAPALFQKARKILINTTVSTRWSVCAAIQAVLNAGLKTFEEGASACGLIVAGSNLAQNYFSKNWHTFSTTGHINPRYAISFWDTNQLGCLSEILSVRGPGVTIGGGAASGNAALFQAFHWLNAGLVERCLVVGAGIEFSELELEGFAVLGAMVSDGLNIEPDRACRPFDRSHSGFVFGEGSAAVILARPESALQSSVLAEIAGASLVLEGNHLPEPSADGEVRAMQAALAAANISPDQIGYLNAHGTATPLGDSTECAAIRTVFKDKTRDLLINSTKSLTGHCFSASGLIELVACVLQLNGDFAHPNRNLENPVDPNLHFVGTQAESLATDYALSNGFGFGGINSAVVVKGRKNHAGRN